MRRRLLLGSLLVLMAALAGVGFFVIAQPVQVLPRMALAPGYAMTDQDGERLTSEDLRGALVVYTFSYGGCGERCALIDGTMRVLAGRLHEVDTGDVPIRLVTITVDPARDTPMELGAAAAGMGADGVVWRLAGGDPATVRQVVGGGFEVFYEPDGEGGVRFDPAFIVVDGWGITRARNRVGVPSVDELLAQLRLLGDEIRASTGVARLAYEAAHLFSCYAY
jgi:protein SCO1